MAWKVPTGVSGEWTRPNEAIDNDTGTYAVKPVSPYNWSPWITVTHAAITCEKIRLEIRL